MRNQAVYSFLRQIRYPERSILRAIIALGYETQRDFCRKSEISQTALKKILDTRDGYPIARAKVYKALKINPKGIVKKNGT